MHHGQSSKPKRTKKKENRGEFINFAEIGRIYAIRIIGLGGKDGGMHDKRHTMFSKFVGHTGDRACENEEEGRRLACHRRALRRH